MNTSNKHQLTLKIVKQTDSTVVTKIVNKCVINMQRVQIVKMRKNETHTSLFLKVPKQSVQEVKQLEQLCLTKLQELNITVDEHVSSLIIDVQHSTLLRLKLTKPVVKQHLIEGAICDVELRVVGIRCQKGVSHMIWGLQNVVDQKKTFGELQACNNAIEECIEECIDECIGPCQEDWQDMVNSTINVINEKLLTMNNEIDKMTKRREHLLSMKHALSEQCTLKDLERMNEELETL